MLFCGIGPMINILLIKEKNKDIFSYIHQKKKGTLKNYSLYSVKATIWKFYSITLLIFLFFIFLWS